MPAKTQNCVRMDAAPSLYLITIVNYTRVFYNEKRSSNIDFASRGFSGGTYMKQLTGVTRLSYLFALALGGFATTQAWSADPAPAPCVEGKEAKGLRLCTAVLPTTTDNL